MSSPLSVTAKVAVALADLLNVFKGYEQIGKPIQHPNQSNDRYLNVLNRVALFGISMFEIVGILRGVDATKMSQMKKVEAPLRIFNIALRNSVFHPHANLTGSEVLRFYETNFIAPIADTCRTFGEQVFYGEKVILDGFPEVSQRPVTKLVEKGMEFEIEVVGYRDVDRDECQRTMDRYSKMANRSYWVALMAEIGLELTSVGVKAAALAVLKHLGVEGNAPTLPELEVVDEHDRINLRALKRLPAFTKNDRILGSITCPITLDSIRFVVGDPTTTPPCPI